MAPSEVDEPVDSRFGDYNDTLARSIKPSQSQGFGDVSRDDDAYDDEGSDCGTSVYDTATKGRDWTNFGTVTTLATLGTRRGFNGIGQGAMGGSVKKRPALSELFANVNVDENAASGVKAKADVTAAGGKEARKADGETNGQSLAVGATGEDTKKAMALLHALLPMAAHLIPLPVDAEGDSDEMENQDDEEDGREETTPKRDRCTGGTGNDANATPTKIKSTPAIIAQDDGSLQDAHEALLRGLEEEGLEIVVSEVV